MGLFVNFLPSALAPNQFPVFGVYKIFTNTVTPPFREGSFGERENYMHSLYLLPKLCILSRMVISLECIV